MGEAAGLPEDANPAAVLAGGGGSLDGLTMGQLQEQR